MDSRGCSCHGAATHPEELRNLESVALKSPQAADTQVIHHGYVWPARCGYHEGFYDSDSFLTRCGESKRAMDRNMRGFTIDRVVLIEFPLRSFRRVPLVERYTLRVGHSSGSDHQPLFQKSSVSKCCSRAVTPGFLAYYFPGFLFTPSYTALSRTGDLIETKKNR